MIRTNAFAGEYANPTRNATTAMDVNPSARKRRERSLERSGCEVPADSD
jgi:hypothetical protein